MMEPETKMRALSHETKEGLTNIPDLGMMTDDEVGAMIEEARQQIRAGKGVPFEEFKREVNMRYGFSL